MLYLASARRWMVVIAVAIHAPHILSAGESVNLLSNSGAEFPPSGENQPPSWFAASLVAPELRLFIDDRHSRAGNASLAIANEHQYEQMVCNNWAQDVRSIPRGKTVRLKGYLRTDGAEAASICVQCWTDQGKRMAAFASTPVFRGTCGWTLAQAADLAVPPETTRMIVRAVLTGQGKAYFDDLSLEIVQDEFAITNPYDPQFSPVIARRLPVSKDCMVLAYLPRWDRGDVDNIGVGDNGVRTLLDWEMPSRKEIDDASLRFVLAVYCRNIQLHDESGRLEAYKVLGPWRERTCWNTQPALSPDAAAAFNVPQGEGWKMFDVTDLVREQARVPQANFGVALHLSARTGNKNVGSQLNFASREADVSAQRPLLLVLKPNTEPFGR